MCPDACSLTGTTHSLERTAHIRTQTQTSRLPGGPFNRHEEFQMSAQVNTDTGWGE